MKAVPLFHHRIVLAPDAFAEVVIWRVSASVPPSSHEFKYRLAYVVGGKCVVRYDNERGKGDHRHFGEVQESYVFSGPDQLMIDFQADIARWNHEHGRS
ncbi:toxin-antitoxin system TumE family protein [Desulfonatronum thiosulfatophilum]|uniref:toxin-antitoxin system TumE family protein n=1 Tax=Desulfonatronum thiosulfatophilum TaxID=617002 RepID=UPI000A5A8412